MLLNKHVDKIQNYPAAQCKDYHYILKLQLNHSNYYENYQFENVENKGKGQNLVNKAHVNIQNNSTKTKTSKFFKIQVFLIHCCFVKKTKKNRHNSKHRKH